MLFVFQAPSAFPSYKMNLEDLCPGRKILKGKELDSALMKKFIQTKKESIANVKYLAALRSKNMIKEKRGNQPETSNAIKAWTINSKWVVYDSVVDVDKNASSSYEGPFKVRVPFSLNTNNRC